MKTGCIYAVYDCVLPVLDTNAWTRISFIYYYIVCEYLCASDSFIVCFVHRTKAQCCEHCVLACTMFSHGEVWSCGHFLILTFCIYIFFSKWKTHIILVVILDRFACHRFEETPLKKNGKCYEWNIKQSFCSWWYDERERVRE